MPEVTTIDARLAVGQTTPEVLTEADVRVETVVRARVRTVSALVVEAMEISAIQRTNPVADTILPLVVVLSSSARELIPIVTRSAVLGKDTTAAARAGTTTASCSSVTRGRATRHSANAALGMDIPRIPAVCRTVSKVSTLQATSKISALGRLVPRSLQPR